MLCSCVASRLDIMKAAVMPWLITKVYKVLYKNKKYLSQYYQYLTLTIKNVPDETRYKYSSANYVYVPNVSCSGSRL